MHKRKTIYSKKNKYNKRKNITLRNKNRNRNNKNIKNLLPVITPALLL